MAGYEPELAHRILRIVNKNYPQPMALSAIQDSSGENGSIAKERWVQTVRGLYEEQLVDCKYLQNGDVWIDVTRISLTPLGRSAAQESGQLASGYIGMRSSRVTIVPLREDEEPAKVLNNVCEQRWYVAKLVQRLSDAAPAVIVIDKTFAPDSCDRNDPGTLELISAVQNSPRLIVAAAPTHLLESDPKGACLVAKPSLDFGRKRGVDGPSDKPAINLGTSRLNGDVRKVPFYWFVYRSDEAFKNGENPSDVFEKPRSQHEARGNGA